MYANPMDQQTSPPAAQPQPPYTPPPGAQPQSPYVPNVAPAYNQPMRPAQPNAMRPGGPPNPAIMRPMVPPQFLNRPPAGPLPPGAAPPANANRMSMGPLPPPGVNALPPPGFRPGPIQSGPNMRPVQPPMGSSPVQQQPFVGRPPMLSNMPPGVPRPISANAVPGTQSPVRTSVDGVTNQLDNINLNASPIPAAPPFAYAEANTPTKARAKRVYNFNPDGTPATNALEPAPVHQPNSIQPIQQPAYNDFNQPVPPGPNAYQPPQANIARPLQRPPGPPGPPGPGPQQPPPASGQGYPQAAPIQPQGTYQPAGPPGPPRPTAPMNQQQQFQQQQFQQQQQQLLQQQQQANKSRIDPNQIPSPVQVQEQDQQLHEDKEFGTGSKGMVPLASTDFKAVDEGNCNPRFIRVTTYNVPQSEELLETSQLPLGLIVQPLAKLRPDEEQVQLVDFGEQGPVRCRRCKAYINSAVLFIDGGRKFVCNLCGFDSEVPMEYFCNLDMNGHRTDQHLRPELRYGTVEFTVPQEYWNRPPAPVNYIFAVDVSWNAIQSGMLVQFCQTLRSILYGSDEKGPAAGLPQGAKIGIVTYDRTVHFYNLKAGLEQAQMMVVPDVTDVFVPLSEGFLVDPVESRDVIITLLDTLPKLFEDNKIAESVFAPAVRAALLALKNLGGKLLICQTTLPTYGPNGLKTREDPKLYGTEKEKTLLVPQDASYRTLAEQCVDEGLCVDLFLFPNAYIDIATLGVLSALTGGEIYYYPNFERSRDGQKYAFDLQHNLTREFGYNGVMRIRCSNGLRIHDHLGNFHMKNSTDIELAGVDSDKAIGVIVKYDGKLDEKIEASFQCALLYTTVTGQRRVRVHTLSIPVTSLLTNVFRYAEMDTTINLLGKQALTHALSKPMRDVREELTEKCVKILSAYRKNCASSTAPGQLILPESFKLFPLYTLTLTKSKALRNGNDITSDIRVANMRFLNRIGVADSIIFLHPRMFAVHNMEESDGIPGPTGRIKLPPLVRLSYQRLDPTGAYLLENGHQLMFWVGRQVPPEFVQDVFGVNTVEHVDSRLRELPVLETTTSIKIRNLIAHMQLQRTHALTLSIARQQLDVSELEFVTMLMEDKNNDAMSYVDYLCVIHRQIQNEVNKETTYY